MATTAPFNPINDNEGSIGNANRRFAEAYINTIVAQTIYGNLVGSITGNAPTADNAAIAQYVANDVGNMRFHWSGQAGQPPWLWGSFGDPNNMYLFDPAVFSVNYANGAGNVGGYTAAQIIAAAAGAVTPGSTVAVLTGGQNGGTIPLPSGFTETQCKFFWIGINPSGYTGWAISRSMVSSYASYNGIYMVIGVK